MTTTFFIFSAIFIVQSFLAGIHFQDRFGWAHDFPERLWVIIVTLLILVGALPIAISVAVFWIIAFPFIRGWQYFQMNFTWDYIILRKKYEIEHFNQERYDAFVEHLNTKNIKWYHFREKIQKWQVAWIAKQVPNKP